MNNIENVTYRPEIDGLRAVAVMAVVFFHFNIPGFNGGFVGVDVFFVISGFLVTESFFKGSNGKHLQIKAFYIRRLKRILPAVILVLFSSLFIAYFLFDSYNFKEFSKSSLASSIFSSNIYFGWQINYFDNPGIVKPLLHTWSLSVEEQFYIVFPFCMLLVDKYFRKKFGLSVLIIFLISFCFSSIFVFISEKATFYSMPLRAWELLSGSLVYFVFDKIQFKNIFYSKLLPTLGLLFILCSITLFSKNSIFPGPLALLPVLGACLIIAYGSFNNTVVKKILTIDVMVLIGKCSFSIYLWHWPLLAFSRYLMLRQFTGFESLLFIIFILVLSFYSWKFVEQPFRFRYFKSGSNNKLVVYTFSCLLCLIVLSLIVYKKNGLPERFPENSLLIEATADTLWDRINREENQISKYNQSYMPLKIGNSNKVPKILLWGDSHACALAIGYENSLKISNQSGYLASKSATPPLLGINNESNLEMIKFNDLVIKFIEKHPEIEIVILAARWSYYFYDTQNILSAARPRFYDNYVTKTKRMNGNNKDFVKVGIERVIDKLLELHKRVILVTPVPELKMDLGNLIGVQALQNRFGAKNDIQNLNNYSLTGIEFQTLNGELLQYLNKIKSNKKIELLETDKLFKSGGQYPIVKNQKLLYRDINHVSKYGSLIIGAELINLFKKN